VIFNKHIKSARYSLIEVYATILTVQECRCDTRHIYEFVLLTSWCDSDECVIQLITLTISPSDAM